MGLDIVGRPLSRVPLQAQQQVLTQPPMLIEVNYAVPVLNIGSMPAADEMPRPASAPSALGAEAARAAAATATPLVRVPAAVPRQVVSAADPSTWPQQTMCDEHGFWHCTIHTTEASTGCLICLWCNDQQDVFVNCVSVICVFVNCVSFHVVLS